MGTQQIGLTRVFVSFLDMMHSGVKGKQDCSTNTKQRQKTHVKHRITSINTRQKSINTFYGELFEYMTGIRSLAALLGTLY